jgi:putative DNA primase/helicase
MTRWQSQLVTDSIPVELRRRCQWVVWRQEGRSGKRTKVPYCARTRRHASVTAPRTWTSFADALAVVSRYDGIAFVLTADDPYVGWDLDNCLALTTQRLEPWALEIVRAVDSYTEVSPSGRGIRIFARGALPPHGRKRGPIEVYAQRHMLSVTGRHLPGTPATIQERTDAVAALHLKIFGRAPTPQNLLSRAPVALDDHALLERAHHARNGNKFARLWTGRVDAPSHSEADLRLCHLLAFWTGRDPDRMDRLFRRSGLFRPKWDEPHAADGRTYGEMTIAKAIAGCREVYRLGGRRPIVVKVVE